MGSDAQNPLVDQWLARLEAPEPDHERFVGAPLSIDGLTPLDLGRLWAAVRRAAWWTQASTPAKDAAQALRRACEAAGLTPVFDADSGLQVLQTVANRAWPDAVLQLAALSGEATPEIRGEVRRILGRADDWPEGRSLDVYQASALARIAGEDRQADIGARLGEVYADCLVRRAEIELLPLLGTVALLALAGARNSYFWAAQAGDADASQTLAGELAYADFARESLESALRRLQDIHAGRVPYRADGVFPPDDAHVLARCARVAAWRDDAWYRALIVELFPLACVAPSAAKTVPSQSLAIALGHSIEGAPTPEGLRALREALAVVRHAGIEKKLARNLKPAERALAARPEVALRLTSASPKVDRKLQTMIATCLESGWWQQLAWTAAQWLEQLAGPVNGQPFASGLVWRASEPDGASCSVFMATPGAPPTFVDAQGQAVAWHPGWTLSLWHPLNADADEREAWRAALARRHLRQPLRQVFRETYPAPADAAAATSTDAFAGHELSIRPLIGLARREGWRVDRWAGLVRTFGATRATFRVGADLYPGLEGRCDSMTVHVEQAKGRAWVPVAIGSLDPIVFSEVCRAVDLLVSTCAFALDDDRSSLPLTVADLGVHLVGGAAPDREPTHPRVARERRVDHLGSLPLAAMARSRRDAIARVFADAIAQGRVQLDERHVRVGPHAVHLATGRVTRDGEAVELPIPAPKAQLAAVPWLPYDEVLLQRIADAVGTLLSA